MRFDVVTLFPEMVDLPLAHSMIGRARKQGLVELGFANPRDFSADKHKTVDDRPYGGGPGMVMMAEPVYQAIKSVRKKNSLVVALGPKGRRFDQNMAAKFAKEKHIVLLCGHYEGIDARVLDCADMELSVGDYVLTGGEPAAVAVIDAVSRLLPGFFKKEQAPKLESFSGGLLEAPHYTRPAVWRRKKVPQPLVSGNHALINDWRSRQAESITRKLRPDLIKNRT